MDKPRDINQADWERMSRLQVAMFCAKEVAAGYASPDCVVTRDEIERMKLTRSAWAAQADPDGRIVIATFDDGDRPTVYATTLAPAGTKHAR